MNSFFQWLLGGGPKTIPAEPLKTYPTPEDAAFAQQAGVAYGTPADAYVQGLAGKVFGSFEPGGKVDPFVPSAPQGAVSKTWAHPSTNIAGKSGVSQDLRDKLAEAFTQAQLATNYLPVAALGFDPSRAVIDATGKPTNIAGVYSPKQDMMMAALLPGDPSAIIHESVHRGFKKLAGQALPEAITNKLQQPGGEELLVRQLMQNYAGDPEQGETDIKQKAAAGINPVSSRDIAALNALIAKLMAESKPRGPR